ncbi:hypothetical protein Rhopal_005469-T1 [Rhodotorula paludigena]|uniref:Bromodomain-containing protein n=1 Tax=Rhodotorula paludigena TaxID=86838 RepID=A0AAV5GPL8_9BASI|nr:hypothetical protein Rhopal_005469-T1 [Rhodotorula paludigena]
MNGAPSLSLESPDPAHAAAKPAAAALASSSLPTPPTTTSLDRPASPPMSLDAPPAPAQPEPLAGAVEQKHEVPAPAADSPAASLPPPPAVPLPAHLGLPAKLEHTDSSSSVAAQPPTPAVAVPPAPPVTAPEQDEPKPLVNGSAGAQPPVHDVNGAYEQLAESTGAHPGLGAPVPAGLNGDGDAQQQPLGDGPSAVDVLADVAMGEAALGLADFAAGAGSADVRAGSPALPPAAAGEAGVPQGVSPPLKRSAPDGEAQEGYFSGGQAGDVEQEREAKRLKVEAEASPVAPSPGAPAESPFPGSAAPMPAAPAVVEPTPGETPSALPASSAAPPAPSPTPTPVQGYDPSAFTTAPTLASSAPPYPPAPAAAAPTMSPSDLHNFHASSLPPPTSASPLPPSALPSSSAPAGSPGLYTSPDAFSSQGAVASTSAAPDAAAAAPADGQNGADGAAAAPAGPSEPEPMHIITKEQQKHAINMVRNLKRNKNAPPFLKPVDAVALLIPDYYKIILEPMDLGTIEARLQATGKGMAAALKAGRTYGLDYSEGRDPDAKWEGQVPDGEEPHSYRTIEEFKHDLDLVWNNCFRYNGPREKNPVSAMAGLMQDAAEKAYRGMPFSPMISPYPPKYVEPPKPVMSFPPRPAENTRPKREIHAPAKDLPYLESAGVDVTAGGIYNLAGLPGYGPAGGAGGGGGQKKVKSAQKIAQEQMRFCKEVVKELFKKVHEPYAYPFYQPVDVAAYPAYLQYIKKPMDLTTIRHKVEHNQYPSPPYQHFEADVRLIFQNCYAFNPPNTPVHDMGRRLESVFEARWAERPMAYEDDSEDDEDGLSVMEQQLNLLQQNIELMKQQKKAQKEAKRFAQLQQRIQQQQQAAAAMPMPMSMPSVPKPPKKQPSQSAYAMSPYGQQPAPPRPKKSSSNGPRPGGGGGAPKKPKRRRDDDSDDYYEDDGGAYYGGGSTSTSRRHTATALEPAMEEFVDFEMKRELAVKIVAFEGDQLEEAINIIRRGRPDLLGAANQEIELDIDQLDQRTLLDLYRYVCPGSQPAVRPVQTGAGAARGGSSKPPKPNRNARKNLDEELEAQRIEALEAQLASFDTPAAAAAAGVDLSGAGLEGAGAEGGDQASSDSSSDEGSDSDSDEE